MASPDWRNPQDYEPLRALDTADLAGEFLRRNPGYREDRARLAVLAEERRLTTKERAAFALRWGTRFRLPRCAPALDPAGASDRGRHWRNAAGAGIAALDR